MSLIALGASLLAGCASQSSPPPLSVDHPANPDAAAAPTRTPSMTLAVNEPVRSAPPAPMPGMQHGGMHHGSGHMNHGAPGAGPATPAIQHESHQGHGSGTASAPATTQQPAAAQAVAGQALYACPMHPKVVSTNPADRCPECKMKINKPVKKASAPITPPAAPAGGNAGHSVEHGGH